MCEWPAVECLYQVQIVIKRLGHFISGITLRRYVLLSYVGYLVTFYSFRFTDEILNVQLIKLSSHFIGDEDENGDSSVDRENLADQPNGYDNYGA